MRKLLVLLLLASVCIPARSQMTMAYENELDHYNKGIELLEKQKYGAAKAQFEQSLEDISDQNSEVSANAHFYIAQCALELFHKDAEFLLKRFIENYSTSPRVKDAWFFLGTFNYRKKDWIEAIYYFDQLELVDLEEPRKSEVLFKRGYAYFMEENLDAAADQFYQMDNEASVYFAPGVYYYAHINYSQEKYATALKSFRRLENHAQFGEVVPYYIVQIHYYLEDYESLETYGSTFLVRDNVKRKHEISRLLGEAFYARQMYAEAVPFLEDYILSPYQKGKTDYYEMGYALLKANRYDDAAAYFSKVSYTDDSLAQNAQYHMGEAYLKADKKAYARNAYRSAARADFDSFIAEDALFKYAKLSYELAYDPYDGAISAFKEYTRRYPKATHTQEAFDYLVQIYLTSKNYDAALASIEEYENPDFRLQEAYQRIAFNKGVNEFKERSYGNAVRYFDKALIYPASKTIAAKAHYWKAESFYDLKKWEQAVSAYQQFLYAPGAILTGFFNMANYSIGYAYFQQDNYGQAPEWFRRYTSYRAESDTVRLADANLRIADCFYMLKDYDAAGDYYEQASTLGGLDQDYALLQTAITKGRQNKVEEKITRLNSLVADYPDSEYRDEAFYELGKAHQQMQNSDEAIKNMQIVVKDFPGSNYVRNAMVTIGQEYFNQRKNDEAEAIYLKVIEMFPTYEDTKTALLGLQNIYIDKGDVDAYENLVSGLDYVNISELQLDTLAYEAAAQSYFQENPDCDRAIRSFTKYLDTKPAGSFRLQAHYYRAECLRRMGQANEAKADYELVASAERNRFSEGALLQAARLNYKKEIIPEALAFYQRLSIYGQFPENLLEAEVGQMRCNYALNNYQGAIANATIAIENEKLGPAVRKEAILILAKSNLKLDNASQALPYLNQLVESGSPSQAAEASYYLSRFEFNRDSLDRSEEMIFKLVENFQTEGYWMAKGLILLSDIYTTRGDLFQAKATLQSIIDNYKEEDDVRRAALQKLDTIIEIENQEKVEEEPIPEIDLTPIDSNQVEPTVPNTDEDEE